jgi:peptide/nickel transport system ATP-binding protein
MALLLISHNLTVMARRVRRLMVMYAGQVIEQGPADDLFRSPAHPYTRGLFAAQPRRGLPRGTRLATLPGRVPTLGQEAPGCAFADRCAQVQADCRATAPAERASTLAERSLRCWHPVGGP